MLCPKCGISNPDNNNFCQSCGAGLVAVPSQPTIVPRQAPSSFGNVPPPPVASDSLNSLSSQASIPTPNFSTPPPPPIPTSETTSVSANLEYVGFWKRLLAYFVDALILGLVGGGMGFYVNISAGNTTGGLAGEMTWLQSFISFIVGAGYYIFFWVNQNGQTLGNRLLAIRVIREDNQPFDVGTGVVRYIGYLLSTVALFLGFIWVAFDSKKQGWHDKIAKTVVVKTEGKSHVGIAILLFIGFLFFIFAILVIMGFGLMFLAKEAKKNPDAAKKLKQEYGVDMSKSEITQNQADKLADDVFTAVNKSRQERGLAPIQLGYKLCAYAQRRLEQLSQLGRHDDDKGFYEDLANPEISQAYFSDYTTIGESVRDNVAYYDQADKDVKNSLESGSNSPANSTEVRDGCTRANTQFIVFITANRK